MPLLAVLRKKFSQAWLAYVSCFFVLLTVGSIKDDVLIPVQIGAVLLTLAYYLSLDGISNGKERGALFFQPILLTISGSVLLLYLEETLFKMIVVVVLSLLHALYLFHLRYSCRESGSTLRKGMLDSIRVLTQFTVFFLAALFFVPLFYFNVRYGFLFAVPFLTLVACVVWNIAWFEGLAGPRRFLTTAVFILVILEVTLVQLWLPSSYMVQALGTSVTFFLLYDGLIKVENLQSRSVNNILVSFIIGLGVVVCIGLIAQWR